MPLVVHEPISPFLNGRELREVLGVSRETLRLWRQRGLPHYGGVGILPRYQLDEVRAWLESKRVAK